MSPIICRSRRCGWRAALTAIVGGMGDHEGRSRLVRGGENLLPLPEFGLRIARNVASGCMEEFITDAVQFVTYKSTRRHNQNIKFKCSLTSSVSHGAQPLLRIVKNTGLSRNIRAII
jgi:hypothetical protein